jgi:hypothetical protein
VVSEEGGSRREKRYWRVMEGGNNKDLVLRERIKTITKDGDEEGVMEMGS